MLPLLIPLNEMTAGLDLSFEAPMLTPVVVPDILLFDGRQQTHLRDEVMSGRRVRDKVFGDQTIGESLQGHVRFTWFFCILRYQDECGTASNFADELGTRFWTASISRDHRRTTAGRPHDHLMTTS